MEIFAALYTIYAAGFVVGVMLGVVVAPFTK